MNHVTAFVIAISVLPPTLMAMYLLVRSNKTIAHTVISGLWILIWLVVPVIAATVIATILSNTLNYETMNTFYALCPLFVLIAVIMFARRYFPTNSLRRQGPRPSHVQVENTAVRLKWGLSAITLLTILLVPIIVILSEGTLWLETAYIVLLLMFIHMTAKVYKLKTAVGMGFLSMTPLYYPRTPWAYWIPSWIMLGAIVAILYRLNGPFFMSAIAALIISLIFVAWFGRISAYSTIRQEALTSLKYAEDDDSRTKSIKMAETSDGEFHAMQRSMNQVNH